MKYVSLTFPAEIDRVWLSQDGCSDLKARINELENQAACLAPCIYILRPEKYAPHQLLLEEIERLFRRSNIPFLILPLDTEAFYRWNAPRLFFETLNQWDYDEMPPIPPEGPS